MSSYIQDVASGSDQGVSRTPLRTILRLKLKTFSESRLNSTWKETMVVIPASATESECSTLIDFATDETSQLVEGSGEGGPKNGDYRLEEENCSWGAAPKPSRGKTASMRHHSQLPFRQINFNASTEHNMLDSEDRVRGNPMGTRQADYQQSRRFFARKQKKPLQNNAEFLDPEDCAWV